MTIEQLIQKKEALQKEREQMIANVNAIGGAIQLITEMIAEEEATQDVAPADKPGE